MRARLALMVNNTTCHIREVKLSRKPAELIAASPKATVPVIVTPDGTVIEQSLDIMRWALRRNDPEGWLEREDTALIEANDGPFKHHLDRYKYPDRYDSDPARHGAAATELLQVLETRLSSQQYLCGDKRGVTDMAIFPFVRQFAATDQNWFDAQPLARVQEWLRGHLSSGLFNSIMVRLEPWQPGDPPLEFPSS